MLPASPGPSSRPLDQPATTRLGWGEGTPASLGAASLGSLHLLLQGQAAFPLRQDHRHSLFYTGQLQSADRGLSRVHTVQGQALPGTKRVLEGPPALAPRLRLRELQVSMGDAEAQAEAEALGSLH